MGKKYRAMRRLGLDPIASLLLATLSAVIQPPNVIRVLNVEVAIHD